MSLLKIWNFLKSKIKGETHQQENKHQTVKRMSNQTWSEINILRIKANDCGFEENGWCSELLESEF